MRFDLSTHDVTIVSLWFLCLIQSAGGPRPHPSNERYYHPGPGPNEERSWAPHMDSYELMVGAPAPYFHSHCN